MPLRASRVQMLLAVAIATAWLAGPAISRDAAAGPGKPAPGPSDPQRAELDRLDRQAAELTTQQASFAAVKVMRQALALQIQASGLDHPLVKRRKERLATALRYVGDHRGELALRAELLAATEREFGPESAEVVGELREIGSVYNASERYDDLDATTQRILAITAKLHGERSKPYLTALSEHAGYLFSRREYTAAQLVYEQSLQLQESLTPDDSQLVDAIETVSSAAWMANQRARAVALSDRALAITERPGTTFERRDRTLSRAIELVRFGDQSDRTARLFDKRIALVESEIASLRHDRPDADQEIASLIGRLASIHEIRGDLAGAERLYRQAIDIEDRHGRAATWRTSLAHVERQQGRVQEALDLLDRAVKEIDRTTPGYAAAYDPFIADMAREAGDYPRAEKLLAAYRAKLEHSVGRRDTAYGYAQLSTAYLYMASGKLALAEKFLVDGLELSEQALAVLLRTGTDADHQVNFEPYRFQLGAAVNFGIAFAPHSASAARLGLTTVLRRKGRLLDAAAASVGAIRAQLSPADRQLLDQLASARAQLAKLTVAGPTATGSTDFAKEVAALEAQVRALEVQVARKSAAYRAVRQPITLAAVQKAIPADARLVEIINFQAFDPRTSLSFPVRMPPRHYAAYVVGHTGDPVVIDLGPVAAIDDAAERFRRAVSDPDNDRAGELGHALFALTIAPLAPALGRATSVLIAPDSALNLVPFAALVDDRGELLIERYTFTYLTSGRDLLRIATRPRAPRGGAIFADPSFDAATPSTAAPPGAPGPPASASRGQRSVELGLQSWKPLPGTGQEADEIGRRMPGLAIYRGAQATETALKAVHGPRILHLATHGFFLRDDRSDGPIAPAAASLPAAENPLLRAGLALAGANHLVSGDDDGILTAMEASGLDLSGTQLVVLSACDTGVGKISNGDGVYGLRRALIIAGAESLVMSLWQVDDTATRDLMAGYYARLSSGKPRSAALRDVQLELQRNPKYAHPYYWASFLPAGDGSPIR